MDMIEQIMEAGKTRLPGVLGFELVSADAQTVVGRVEVQERNCTIGDILHGGAIMALADTLGALGAFLNLEPGQWTTTVESKTNFVGQAPRGQTVTATSSLMHKGRTMMLWHTELKTEDGRQVAFVSQSQMILKP